MGDSFVVSGGERLIRVCGRVWLGVEEDADRRWGLAVCRRHISFILCPLVCIGVYT